MTRFMLKPAVCVLLWGLILGAHVGCPNPETGKIDPYLTAKTIILQANTALALADGIFNQWLLGQADAEKAKKTEAIYTKTRTSVANGLQLALNGVAIAEQAKKDPDIKLLMAEANKAWTNLRKFLEDLLAKEDDAALVEAVAGGTAPASQPTTTSGEVKSATSALTQKVSPLHNLPKTLGGS
jgi:hypothetical protein